MTEFTHIYQLKPNLTDEIEMKSSNEHLLLPFFTQHETSGFKVQTKFQSENQQFHNTTSVLKMCRVILH